MHVTGLLGFPYEARKVGDIEKGRKKQYTDYSKLNFNLKTFPPVPCYAVMVCFSKMVVDCFDLKKWELVINLL